MGLLSYGKKLYLLQSFIILSSYFDLQVCTSLDVITSSQPIKDDETIIANDGAFALGFFSPANTSNRYLGIWHNIVPERNFLWVANRDKPLLDSSGIVTISENGNLVILDGQNRIIWSSNVSDSAANSSAQLLGTGNLVVRDNSSGRTIWESFEDPSDSLLPRMRITTDENTGEKTLLKSWESPSDPSSGIFSAGLDPVSIPEIVIWKDTDPYWRSGPWNGRIFIGVPDMDSVYLSGFSLVDNKEGMVYMTFIYANVSHVTYFLLNSEGILVQKYWYEGMENWEINWSSQVSECDFYGKCGPFGSCNSKESPICSCLRGFEPKDPEEWKNENWTSGCVRKTPLLCERNTSENQKGKEDGFLQSTTMKLPDFAEWSPAFEDGCEAECLKNCSCAAYAYHTGIGCMLWSGNIIDTQKFSSSGADLYVRMAYTDLDKKGNAITIIATTVSLGAFAVSIVMYLAWRWITKRRGGEKESELLLFDRRGTDPKCSSDQQAKFEELPLFNFEKLAIATDNFNSANKLGQGGFGPVYKGKLPDGQEIAVKRLSRASGQGLEEFMNEVVLISKLQHRNLVRLLGCCVEGEEKMLIYEYMPNKSLDAFLFDPVKQKVLDWRKRSSIVEGIGRGLLYLHRDSRLRIIHRDLKASNILLDEELNPKISDFGMARIFGGNQDQANTRRVVGTYGYMAPEYAMEGRFSEKSDVFSFGVLLLEIVSGRRNTSFYHDEHSLSLLGFAWKLWNDDEILKFIDTAVYEQCYKVEILRCIQVGLLCVQEFAKDRPSVSTALSMLSSEISDLLTPKQPAFTERQISSDSEPSQQSQKRCSLNNVTITNIEGR